MKKPRRRVTRPARGFAELFRYDTRLVELEREIDKLKMPRPLDETLRLAAVASTRLGECVDAIQQFRVRLEAVEALHAAAATFVKIEASRHGKRRR